MLILYIKIDDTIFSIQMGEVDHCFSWGEALVKPGNGDAIFPANLHCNGEILSNQVIDGIHLDNLIGMVLDGVLVIQSSIERVGCKLGNDNTSNFDMCGQWIIKVKLAVFEVGSLDHVGQHWVSSGDGDIKGFILCQFSDERIVSKNLLEDKLYGSKRRIKSTEVIYNITKLNITVKDRTDIIAVLHEIKEDHSIGNGQGIVFVIDLAEELFSTVTQILRLGKLFSVHVQGVQSVVVFSVRGRFGI